MIYANDKDMKTLDRELAETKRIARDAGAILMRYFAASTAVEWKAPGDPVTIADREASELIVAELRSLFPEDGILSEEMADDASRFSRARVWMVDPMDGTREFIAGREDFAVMIGLIEKGRPALGVVYQPATDKLYFSSRGEGAHLEHQAQIVRLRVSQETVASRLVIAMSRSHRSARVDRIAEQLRIRQSIRMGSVGLKTGLICEGRAHLYIHAGNQTKIWDTCAPEAILIEAGGMMTDIYGNALDYTRQEPRNPHGVIASNGGVHARAVSIAAEVIGN